MDKELSSQQLQEYLRQILELEKQNQTVEQTYNNYCIKMKSLAVPRCKVPARPSDRYEVSMAYATWRGIFHGLIGLAICLAVGFGLAALLEACQTDGGLIITLLGILS